MAVAAHVRHRARACIPLSSRLDSGRRRRVVRASGCSRRVLTVEKKFHSTGNRKTFTIMVYECGGAGRTGSPGREIYDSQHSAWLPTAYDSGTLDTRQWSVHTRRSHHEDNITQRSKSAAAARCSAASHPPAQRMRTSSKEAHRTWAPDSRAHAPQPKQIDEAPPGGALTR